jgi:hypothetical protein
MGLGLFSGNAVQDFAYRIPIPRFPVDGGGKLISDAIAFSVHKSLRLATKMIASRFMIHKF